MNTFNAKRDVDVERFVSGTDEAPPSTPSTPTETGRPVIGYTFGYTAG